MYAKSTFIREGTDGCYDYVISVEGRSLLTSLLGRRLKSVEGYRYDLVPIEGKTTFYAVARLHMEDGGSYDLRIKLVRVDIATDFWDDVGAYSFGRAEGEVWLPEGVESFKLPIGRVIDDVLLANDYDVLRADARWKKRGRVHLHQSGAASYRFRVHRFFYGRFQ